MYFFSFNFFLILFLCYSQEDISPSSPSSPSKEITLSKWQYCVGCKATIEIFTTLATSKIVEMEQNGIASGEELDVAPLIKNLCDLAYFERFDPIIRYGCIKLLNDHKYDFLHSFEGDIASTSFSTSKSNIFSKSKQICSNIADACPKQMFLAPPPKQRTECNACNTIIEDFELMKKILPIENRYGNNEINEQLLESLCNSIGFNHQPYSWLENTCDIMLEEHYDDILDIVTLRDKFLLSKMKPKDTLADKVCSKIFDCKSDNEL